MGVIGITGASGMLGRHLLALCRARGHQVVATSRRPPSGDVTWRPSDLAEWREPGQLDSVLSGTDAVVHLGAALPGPDCPTAAGLIDLNVRATLVLGQWALKAGKPVVFMSSGSVYGETAHPVAEDAPLADTPLGGFYGLSKQLAERVLDHLAAQGLRRATIRPTAIYGWGTPGDKMIAGFLARAAAGETIEVAPPLDDRVNLVHAADVARAVLAAVELGAQGVFNVAGPAQVSMVELAQACVRAAGKGEVRTLDGACGRAPVNRFQLDTARAAGRLGYAPRVGVETGLDLMLRQACLPEEDLP